MRTPAGKECAFYYQDFHRDRHTQQCRLVEDKPDSLPWQPADCSRCPVPDILHANASEHLRISLTIKPMFLGLGRKLDVHAFCDKHMRALDDPYVGCPECNAERPGLEAFIRALEESDDD